MTGELNLLSYFFQASIVVKFVMLALVSASAATWWLIFQRSVFFKQQQQNCDQFARRFWDAQELSQLYLAVESQPEKQPGLASIFHTGYREYIRAQKKGALSLEPIERVMQIHQAKESMELEKSLAFFASVGSIAPYVGLFGTVWGIMASFQALGHAQQATIAMVAPGISEALVATALGLFTAIPSVIAYNRFSTRANQLMNRYQLFQDEFIALVDEQTSMTSRGL